MSGAQVIVSIAAEGGSIVLYGQKDSKGDWAFSRGVADQTPTFLNDVDGKGGAVNHASVQVATWQEAVALLDKYPWAMLSGLEVHPEFRGRVWEEISRRLARTGGPRAARCKDRWAEVCDKAEGAV